MTPSPVAPPSSYQVTEICGSASEARGAPRRPLWRRLSPRERVLRSSGWRTVVKTKFAPLRSRAAPIGSVFADRYHARELRSPREVRAALVYMLNNARHHGVHLEGIDPFCSGLWFDGGTSSIASMARASFCVRPRSWLLRHGWMRRGRIEFSAGGNARASCRDANVASRASRRCV